MEREGADVVYGVRGRRAGETPFKPSPAHPFYPLPAENETPYSVAYVSEQNLVSDDSGEPVDHPEVSEMFGALREGGRYDLDGHLH